MNIEIGEIVDFVHVPINVRQTAVPRSIALLSNEPWAAALVAQHALTVYDRSRSGAEWAGYFTKMSATRSELLGVTRMSLEDLVTGYAYVRLADLISLAYCTGSIEEIRCRNWTVRRVDSRVIVAPDAFGGADVPIGIAAREVRYKRSDRSTKAVGPTHARDAAVKSAAIT